jgi:uncharacterized protein YfiM (DUF2279 family)
MLRRSVHATRCFLALSFSVSTVLADMWKEEQWVGFMIEDFNPNSNSWQTYEADVTVTPAGSAATTQQSWIPLNTNELGIIPSTTTLDGKAQVTSVTQYVQFALSTVTSSGSTAVQTEMLVAPAIWSAVGDAANEPRGNPGRKRQCCDLFKVAEADIAQFVVARLAKSVIVWPTLTVFGLVKRFQNGALNRAEDDKIPILGTLPASTTSNIESTATAWMVPYLSNYVDLSTEMAAATIPLPYSTLSESTTSTSLNCANTGTASVSASLAYDNVVSFCGQADHLVKIDPTLETSQSFPGMDQNSTLSVSWAASCASGATEYTVTQDDCRTYLNDTINNCETDSNDKHGGSITTECVVFAMVPQPHIPPPPFDNPSSLTPDLPAATVKSLHCPSPTPMAIFYKDDAALAIDRACAVMRDNKLIMAGQSPYLNQDPPHSSGSDASCCSTSIPIKTDYALIQAAVSPFRESQALILWQGIVLVMLIASTLQCTLPVTPPLWQI